MLFPVRSVPIGARASASPEAAVLFVDLMIGDLQIRRVIGVLGELTADQITKRAHTSFAAFLELGGMPEGA
ncbi:hypothetical protein [Nisaea sp.]|uniref:hypothetical protein n=1 Tax=Nisaea sp. TaxID=2024842 RepID=UPI003263E22B